MENGSENGCVCQDFACRQEKKILNQKLLDARNEIAELKAKMQERQEFYQGWISGLEEDIRVRDRFEELLIQTVINQNKGLPPVFRVPLPTKEIDHA